MDIFKKFAAVFQLLVLLAAVQLIDVSKLEVGLLKGLSFPPLNDYTYAESNVTLVCECNTAPPSCRIFWSEYTQGYARQISDDNFILPSHPNAARYYIQRGRPTQFDLVIDNVNFVDAGQYSCFNIQSTPPDQVVGFAQLMVLGSSPKCWTTVVNGNIIEGFTYNNTCSIESNGTIKFNVTWFGPEFYEVFEEASGINFTFGITFTARAGMHLGAYILHIKFEELQDVPPNVASNTPDYSYEHNFGTMFYWPSLTTAGTTLQPPDTIRISTPHLETSFNGSIMASNSLIGRKLHDGVMKYEYELLTLDTVDYIELRCLNLYGREFRQSYRDVIRRVNRQVSSGEMCAGNTTGMVFYAGDTAMLALHGKIQITFAAWLLTNRDTPMWLLEQCFWSIGDYIRNFSNWRVPIIPFIYNCPTITFEPLTFEKIAMNYICQIQEPDLTFNKYLQQI